MRQATQHRTFFVLGLASGRRSTQEQTAAASNSGLTFKHASKQPPFVVRVVLAERRDFDDASVGRVLPRLRAFVRAEVVDDAIVVAIRLQATQQR